MNDQVTHLGHGSFRTETPVRSVTFCPCFSDDTNMELQDVKRKGISLETWVLRASEQ